jgi:hypothetical protein
LLGCAIVALRLLAENTRLLSGSTGLRLAVWFAFAENLKPLGFRVIAGLIFSLGLQVCEAERSREFSILLAAILEVQDRMGFG